MKRILTTLILTIVTTALAFGQNADKKVEDEILKLDSELNAAMVKADVAAHERLLASDFIGTYFIPAMVFTKDALIAAVAKRAKNPITAEPDTRIFDDLKVRLYGDVAVITGHMKEVRKRADGKPFDFKVRFTNVWTKRGEKWQLVSGHATPAMGVYKTE